MSLPEPMLVQSATKPLSPMKINAFATGSFTVALLFGIANTYFTYFITDVALVPAAVMGTAFLITRLIDICWTPLLAGLMQNGKSKLGKYRSWIIYTMPVVFVFVVLCFTKISGPPALMAVLYGLFYLFGFGLLDKPGGAQKALMVRMASSSEERMLLTSRSVQFENIGRILFSACTLPLIALIGGGNEAKGFFWVALLYAALAVAGYYTTAWAGKEYDLYEAQGEKAKDSLTVKQMFEVVIKNPPLLVSMLIESIRFLAFMVFVSTMAYYFKYVINDIGSLTTVLLITSIVCLGGSLIAPAISNKIGKKYTCVLSMALYGAGLLLPRFFAVGNVAFFTFCLSLAYIGQALQHCVGVVLFSDSADYYESKTGVSAHGYIMSMYILPVEVAIAFSIPVVGWFLGGIGYDPTQIPTAAQLVGIQNLVLLVPGLMFAGAFILALFHPLSEKRLAGVRADLQELRARKAARASE